MREVSRAGWLPRWLPKRLLRGRFGGQAKLLAVGALTALVLAGLFASAAGLCAPPRRRASR